jgi:hypothetical protein
LRFTIYERWGYRPTTADADAFEVGGIARLKFGGDRKLFLGVFGKLGFFGVESPIKCGETGVSGKSVSILR